MAKNDYKRSKTAKPEETYEVYDNIKFRKDKKGVIIRFLSKAIIFILISSLSGAVTSYYLTNYYMKKYSATFTKLKINKNMHNHNIYNDALITKTAEDVGPAIVAISNKVEGYFESSDTDCSSGFIFNKNGYIVTAYHTIKNAKKIAVKLSSGRILDGKLLGSDKVTDLAVIKVNAENLPTAKIGDITSLKVGASAITVGNPFGDEYDSSVSIGVISGINRKIQYGECTYKLIQTDAVINQGNSGGVLCNGNEEVIGINDTKFAGMYGNEQGIGFAISINDVNEIITRLISEGKISRPSMGIIGKNVSINNGDTENSQTEAVSVADVLPGGGADEAGIKVGDVLLQVDNKKVYDIYGLSDIMNRHNIGDTVTCRIERNRIIMKFNVKLTEIKTRK